MRITRLLSFAFTTALISLQGTVHAKASDFPNQPVSIVVPTPAAGPLDLFSRLIGPKLAERWGQPVVVRNQPGAGTALGTQTVARAKPDGHTLLMANIAVSAHGALSKQPLFDLEKDLQSVSLIASTPFFLFVPGKGHTDLKSIVEDARKNPGDLNFAIIPNSQQHLDTVRVLNALGIEATLIPYQGTAPITVALLSNEVDAFLGSLGGMQAYLDEGRLRALASTGAEPSKHRPEIPTFRSLGFDIDMEPWYAIFAPAGLPADRLQTLHESLLAVMADPEIVEKISAAGYDPKTSSPEALAKIASDNLALSKTIVRDAKIEAQ